MGHEQPPPAPFGLRRRCAHLGETSLGPARLLPSTSLWNASAP